MFNVGGGEVLVIALIALIVLGPQRLPDAARQVGKAMGELRRLSSGFQDELKTAFEESERSDRTAPARDVLAEADEPEQSPRGEAPSRRPRRRAPLQADPLPDSGSNPR